eukprot:5114092-Prymnesium_polylepis.1
MGMERRGRGTVAPCMSGRREDVGGLSLPTDAVYSLAGLYVPASASHDGACIQAPPQPTNQLLRRASELGLRRPWGVAGQ